jgi:MFS family permease
MKQIENNNSNRNWRNIYLLGATSFFNDFASEMIYPLIPVFINSVLGLGAAFFSTLGGHISDKLGRKTMIVCGWVVYFLTYFGFAFANVPYMIWVLFVFYGLFFGFTEGVRRLLFATWFQKRTWVQPMDFITLQSGFLPCQPL